MNPATDGYRRKYAARMHGGHMKLPPGGADVIALCDTVDKLTAMLAGAMKANPVKVGNEREGR